MRPFWNAALGYRDLWDSDAVDPNGRGPQLAFNDIDRPGRGRTHIDVSVPAEVGAAIVERAVAAGGRLVDDLGPADPGEVVATAFPEQVAKRMGEDYLLASGTRARLLDNSGLAGSPWLAIAEVTLSNAGNPIIRTAARIAVLERTVAQLEHALAARVLRRGAPHHRVLELLEDLAVDRIAKVLHGALAAAQDDRRRVIRRALTGLGVHTDKIKLVPHLINKLVHVEPHPR